MIIIKNDTDKFEIFLDDKKAGEMLSNQKNENTINIYHTEVDEEFSGHGLGKKLVEAAVTFVRENDLKLAATCPYAIVVLMRDKSATDVFIK